MARAHTVLIVDDEDLVRDGYRAFFARRTDFDVVAEATNGEEAVAFFARDRPDVVLMDLQMPRVNGIDATREITSSWPAACVVALTTFGSRDHIIPALRAGAAGYLVKDASQEALITGLYQAMAGEMPLSPAVRRELVGAVAADREAQVPQIDLTQREREVIEWLAHGESNAEIAAHMYVSEGTVKQYLSHIADKLGTRTRTQMLVRAIQLGIVDPRELPPARS